MIHDAQLQTATVRKDAGWCGPNPLIGELMASDIRHVDLSAWPAHVYCVPLTLD